MDDQTMWTPLLKRKFGKIKFAEKNHKYYHTDLDIELISVTTLLKKYQPPFDTDYWSKYKANQRNVSQDFILAEWAELKEAGLKKGTNIHWCIENLIHNKLIDSEYDLTNVYNAYNDVICCTIPIATELVVGNHKIAGQIDYLCYDNNKLTILDWKTDKQIKYNNPYQRMLGCLSHLEDCEFNKYSLQISLYRYILELEDIIVEDSKIIHYSDNEYNVIQIPYLKDEVTELFNSL